MRAVDDYYTHINYQWLGDMAKHMSNVQKYYVQLDSFRVIQEKVYYEIMDLVKDYCKSHKTERSRAIGNVYNSFMTLSGRMVHDHIRVIKESIDTIVQNGSLAKLFAQINKNEVVSWGSPVSWTVDPNPIKSDTYITTLSPPSLSAYDYTLYNRTDKDAEEYHNHFLKYVTKIFDTCLGADHGMRAADVWSVEQEMLRAMDCTEIKGDSLQGDNFVTANELITRYRFDWTEFTALMGYKSPPGKVVCRNLNYLKCIMDSMISNNAWRSPRWVAYFYYIHLRQIVRFHHSWRDIHFEFHGKFVAGQSVPMPNNIYPIFGLGICFDRFLSDEYVRTHTNARREAYVKNIGTDLLEVFKRIVGRNTWLSPNTRKFALLKLKHLKFIIGKPDVQRQDPLLAYEADDAYGNLLRIADWRRSQAVTMDGTRVSADIPAIDWMQMKLISKQPYVVNAYYTPSENSIYVPLAYIQPPFIDLGERGIEYNLAYMGYTLCHEMSHSLDDLGSQYDHMGNLHNWWTPQDREKFNHKVKDVIEQYETFASYDGIKMDAAPSVGEDLADISGMAICVEYLRDFQHKNGDAAPIRALSFHALFTYFAIQARQKIYSQAIRAQLKTNPHPMNKYRTNCPLARLKLFRSMYNVQKNDRMYWPSADTIW